ncbi:4'-phosphopantetheinyl transferase family protein [Kribbella deserti]|uniref:4'-phosphopantetheinyl transferase family protein n=1 Tax=Kribbella deserti TaxID=1926257 RepID=A0ABV6QXP9_9ACTN
MGVPSVHCVVARANAHDLLRELGTSVLGTAAELRHDDSGQPWIWANGTRYWASLSHGRNVVAVALSLDGPVGVDIEARRSFAVDGLVRRWFDPAEVAWLDAQEDRIEAFLWLWTAKEAVGKALGKGLRDAGLRRLMPLRDGLVPGTGLAIRHPDIALDAVLAVAVHVPADPGNAAAVRSTVRSRTSFPVVVRGN